MSDEERYHEIEIYDPFFAPADPSKMAAAPRAVIAFEMRKAGIDFDTIAEKLGYASGESAKRAILQRIEKYYKQSEKEISEVIGMELARLDQLQLLAWQEAKNRNLKAIDTILKIMERRAKLIGLDKDTGSAQITQQVAVVLGGSEKEYLTAIDEARKQLNSGG